jgi:hypothetical protein
MAESEYDGFRTVVRRRGDIGIGDRGKERSPGPGCGRRPCRPAAREADGRLEPQRPDAGKTADGKHRRARQGVGGHAGEATGLRRTEPPAAASLPGTPRGGGTCTMFFRTARRRGRASGEAGTVDCARGAHRISAPRRAWIRDRATRAPARRGHGRGRARPRRQPHPPRWWGRWPPLPAIRGVRWCAGGSPPPSQPSRGRGPPPARPAARWRSG